MNLSFAAGSACGTHETPIVPRFFALYRESEFFLSRRRPVPPPLVQFSPNCRLFLRNPLIFRFFSPLVQMRALFTQPLLSLTPHPPRRIVAVIGEPTRLAPARANWLRVPPWSAEDPLNLLQVMLAKGVYFLPSSSPVQP
jgi:hypothetical protein